MKLILISLIFLTASASANECDKVDFSVDTYVCQKVIKSKDLPDNMIIVEFEGAQSGTKVLISEKKVTVYDLKSKKPLFEPFKIGERSVSNQGDFYKKEFDYQLIKNNEKTEFLITRDKIKKTLWSAP